MSEDKHYMIEKNIRVVKCNTAYACGWGVLEDGTILVEIDKDTWDCLDEKSKMHGLNPDLDYVLGETILQRFLNASYVYDRFDRLMKKLELSKKS